MLGALDISSSALTAFRKRMDIVAANIANISTTRDADGNLSPYRRQEVTLAQGRDRKDKEGQGVHVAGVTLDNAPFRRVYQPGHPDAGPDGVVTYPNVDLNREMVDALIALRAYEANVTAYTVGKQMIAHSMRLIM